MSTFSEAITEVIEVISNAFHGESRPVVAYVNGEADRESDYDERHASDDESEEIKGLVRDCHENLNPDDL